jgi:lysophospholipase L1-like esterase
MRRRVRRVLIGAAVIVVAFTLLLAAEVQLARHGPDLPDDTPLDHDGRVGGPADPALRMVWLGDSTAAGVGASDADHAIPRRVARALDRPVEVVSRAVSGDRVADVVDDQLDGLAALDPDVVLVSIGANDVIHLTSRDDFRRGYEALAAAVPDGALLVILGVPDMGAPDRYLQPLRAIAGFRGRELEEVSEAVARDHDAVYVDIAGETGPTMRSDRRRWFAADRYHPSDDGYRLWADAVLAQLQPALERAPFLEGGPDAGR